MMNYMKLVNFEFNRVAKLFAVLLGITLVLQMIGVVVESRRYLSIANDQMYEQMLSSAQFLASYGQMSFLQVVRSTWFMGPIALCVAGVGFYIFLIWYRDWVGKNTFIYRLLMLPTTRLNIFFAKITTILILTVGLVAFQLIFLPIEMWVMKLMVPAEFRSDIGVLQILTSMPELSIIIPSNFIELILFYGAGLMGVSILFTAILLERSFKWKGIFAGVLYGGAAILLLILPILLHEFVFNQFFYPVELFVLVVLMGVIVFAASVLLSGFLLRKKITV
ncbi:hypothetical protein IMZ08_00375 [Bacillus luteolus]|uniref:Uncharacterized protein n=1 Tax=Litchfieldia luteola TaxID=682179 RepID=A0ABR9QDD4_9BACI|nr:hypothetical protein [Cytobacillus luteolus]MBE4906510.1 hypothetical protein [Cytobacillus luteolus]MBP1941193.1 hypothetical protein [Cytobacillus luteolus]